MEEYLEKIGVTKDMSVAAIAAQQAIFQSNMALSMIKNNAQAQQSMANLIAQAADSVPVSTTSGTRLDINI